jgi:hypothetical protein
MAKLDISIKILLVLGMLSAVAYTVFVSVLVARLSSASAAQKTVQILLCWLFPIIGPFLIHYFHYLDRLKPPPPQKTDFTEQGPNA